LTERAAYEAALSVFMFHKGATKMPPIYYKRFAVTGVINTTTPDTGIECTESEKIIVKALLISVSAYQGNIIEGWVEREKYVELYDYLLNTVLAAGAANAYASTNKLLRIPVEIKLQLGQIFRVAVNAGAAAVNLFGAYEYELE
jgi:hypothetical protein